MSFVRSYLRFFQVALLYVFVPLMALGLPLLAAYGALSPFEGDRAAMSAEQSGVPVLVGVGSGDESCVLAERTRCVPPNRTYLVFPRFLSNGGVSVVNKFSDSTRVESLPGYGLLYFGVWASCAWLFVRKLVVRAVGRA